MRSAVTTSPGEVVLVERPAPRPVEGHVLVEVEQVGVCGTDGHIWTGTYPAAAFPLVQGHEIVGRVAAVGHDTPIPRGARVVVEPLVPCGRCHACRNGRYNACSRLVVLGVHADGGLSELIAVPAERIHPAPQVPLAVAPLVEPTSVALQAVARSGAPVGDHVLVLGCGPIGLLAVVALADRGIRVAAADTDRGRTALAARLGAEVVQVVNPDRYPTRSQHGELLSWSGEDGPGVVIEASGAPAALESAVNVVASAGTVVAVGISSRVAQLPLDVIPYKELDVLGCRGSTGLFPDAIALVTRKAAEVELLVADRFGLGDAGRAFELAHAPGPNPGKIIIAVAGRP